MYLRHTLLRLISIALVTLGWVWLSGCATVSSAQPVASSIAKIPELSTLSSLISKAGLTSTLNGTGTFTVFAPSNDAFKAVSQKTLEDLAANPSKLAEVLTYHVIANKAMAADVTTGSVKTVQGANLALSKAGTFVTVEDAVVQTADIPASNGVIHVVDRVLMPPARR
jgi:uncharacterized surface protein with fasciclin (FAS1) repeats